MLKRIAGGLAATAIAVTVANTAVADTLTLAHNIELPEGLDLE